MRGMGGYERLSSVAEAAEGEEEENSLGYYDRITDSDDINHLPRSAHDRSSNTSLEISASSLNGAPMQQAELEDDHGVSMDSAVQRIGMGRFQWYIMAILGLFFAADAMQVCLLSLLAIVLREDWNLSLESSAGLVSMLFFGSLVGTLLLGPLADSIGRRFVFLLATFIVASFGMAGALSPNVSTLSGTIFMVGIGVGGVTVPFDMVAEFVPSESRGKNLLMINYCWTMGSLLVLSLAYVTLDHHRDHWRYLVALCPTPCLVAFVWGYFCLPESSRWLITRGRFDEAITILRKAAATNGRQVEFLFPAHFSLALDQHSHADRDVTICDLLKPKWRKCTLYLWGTWGLSAFGYYGTIMAITSVFSRHSTNEKDNCIGHMAGYEFDFEALFISCAAELIGTTLAIITVDRYGRILSQAVSYGIAGLSICLLCMLAPLHVPRVLLVALGFTARIFEMTGTCLTWVSTAEVLTTDIRATGHSTSSAMARIGAFLCPYVVVGRISFMYLGIIMLLTHTCTALFVLNIPETKGIDLGVANDYERINDNYEEPLEASEDTQDSPFGHFRY